MAVAYQFLSGHHEPPTGGGPLVVRRLTQPEYQRVIADVFGADIKIGGRFEPDIRQGGLLAVGSGQLSVTPAGFEQYDAMARMIAAQVWIGGVARFSCHAAPDRTRRRIQPAPECS